MSMQKVLVSVPSLRSAPRGALWVGQIVSWLKDLGDEVRAVIATTAEAARKRAIVERAARDRADLIALARRYQGTQPEFAKDLFAAAATAARTSRRAAGATPRHAWLRGRVAILVLEAPICSGLRALYQFG